ncbi:MAG: FliG C-terminal domain-containing protein [Planctomycetota bacterium]|jgi:hypothetical protein
MKCSTCRGSSDGYAVTPGVGAAGEIRFFCDGCARKERVKMRYWDGHDLEVGGWREDPDLGDHFHSLVFSFEDLGRMRRDDLIQLLEWVENEEISAALVGADSPLQTRVLDAMPRARAQKVTYLLRSCKDPNKTELSRRKIVETVRKL